MFEKICKAEDVIGKVLLEIIVEWDEGFDLRKEEDKRDTILDEEYIDDEKWEEDIGKIEVEERLLWITDDKYVFSVLTDGKVFFIVVLTKV